MKTLFLIFFICASHICISQVKGDNTIIASNVTFEKVVNTLLDLGFTIDKIDKDFHTVKTEWKEPNPKYSYEVYYDVRVKDSTAYISGKLKNANFVFDIEVEKPFINRDSFKYMDDFAKSLSSEVSYTKK